MFRKNKQKAITNSKAPPNPLPSAPPNEEEPVRKYNKVPQERPASTTPAQVLDEPAVIKFACQLAHGSPTGFVSGFSNSIQLYEKIAACYDFSPTEVIFKSFILLPWITRNNI